MKTNFLLPVARLCLLGLALCSVGYPAKAQPQLLSAAANCIGGLVTVQFDRHLDIPSAESAGHYALSGGLNVLSATISPDLTKVYLSVDGALTEGQNYTVTVNNVADADGALITPDSQAEFACDPTVPAIEVVRASCAVSRVTVRFTKQMNIEALNNAANFAIDGGITVLSATQQPDILGSNLAIAGLLTPGQTYTVTVNNLSDLLGTPLLPGSQASFICDESTPQLLSAQGACGVASLRLNFNQSMELDGAHETSHYAVSGGLSVSGVQFYGPDNSWDLLLSGPLVEGVEYTVTVNGLVSVLGAPLPADSQASFTCNGLTPELLSAEGACGVERVRLHFNQSMDLAVAVDLNRYAMSGGLTVIGMEFFGPDNSWDLLLSGPLVEGVEYTVTVSGLLSVLGAPLPADSQATFSCNTAVLSLGNLVFRDLNDNGLFEPGLGESGIPNVGLQIFRDNGDGVFEGDELLNFTQTNGDGQYLFSGLSPGGYFVLIMSYNFDPGQPLFGLADRPGAQEANDDVDGDDNGRDGLNPNYYEVVSTLVTLNIGGEPGEAQDGDDANGNQTVDFALIAPPDPPIHRIGDRVWHDLDGDGLRDTGELGIPNVALSLWRDDGDGVFNEFSDTPSGFTNTDSEGRYEFLQKRAGSYFVTVNFWNFQAGGALLGYLSSPGVAEANNDLDDDDNGTDNPTPRTSGIVSTLVTLSVGGEPTADGDDANSNQTVDFGFVSESSSVLPPVAKDDSIQRPPDRSLKIPLATLLSNDTDPGGLVLHVASVQSTSTAGGATVRLQGQWVLYEPPSGFNVADEFTYTLANSAGATSPATVRIEVLAPHTRPTANLSLAVDSGNVIIRVAGIPGRAYQLQFTESLSPPVVWTSLGPPATAPANGQLEFIDPVQPTPRFYRAVEP